MKEIMQIFPASADVIRSWSHGEVKNPETINYRSLKPEKGGLYCGRIFGPCKDWECACGKYKRVKHKGVICDRCGVEVTQSKVRRERMGHIELAVPVVHPWYLHRSKIIADLLAVDNDRLIKVVYYDAHIILEIKEWNYDWEFYSGKIIDETEYSSAQAQYGSRLSAGQGGKAILFLLQNMDLAEELKIAQKVLHDYPPKDNKSLLKLQNKIKAIKFFLENQINPADLVLTVLPIIPADLRPLIPLENGCFASNDLNDLYRRVINRNNRLKNLLKLNTREVIIRNEKRMLQEAVDALIENGLYGRPVTGALNRPLESLTHQLGTGREWRRKKRFAQVKAGKMVDYSATTVAVPDSDLPDDTVLIPYKIAKKLFETFLISELKRHGFSHTVRGAKKVIDRDESIVFNIFEYLLENFSVLVTHPPVINNLRARFFKVGLTRDEALHLSINSFYDMEFDQPSPQAKIFLPLSNKAQFEAGYLVNHPLRQKRRSADARIILKMLECDLAQKPLLCPSFEYAATLYEIKHLPVNTHIQLPEQIHTSMGGALLAMEFPDILSPENYPETVDTAENFLAEKTISPKFKQLLVKYSYLLEEDKSYSNEKIFQDEYIQIYDSGLIGFQKKKFAESLPTKYLNLESVYFSAFADFAYCTYCKNKSHNECSVKECPAHGISGKEKCLFYNNNSFPVYGSAIGINSVYKILENFAEAEMKTAVQMLYKGLKRKDVLRFTSMEELENIFHFPLDFPRKEIELLFAIRKQQQKCDYGTGNFFYDAAKNAPDTILNAIFTGRRIDLMTPDAVMFSGNKTETCAIESAMKDDMDNAKFFLPDSIADEPDDSDENFLLDFDKDEKFDNSEEDNLLGFEDDKEFDDWDEDFEDDDIE